MSQTKAAVVASKTVVANFSTKDQSYEDGVWVLQNCSSCLGWTACSLSNGHIQVYNDHLSHIQTYNTAPDANNPHSTTITDLRCHQNTIIHSSTDGTVALYDIRQPSPALSFKITGQSSSEHPLTVDLGYDGLLSATGGTKANIYFHDLRNTAILLGAYKDAHTEEITRVRFHSHSLLSAAEDGLVALFDTTQPNEELATKSVLNIGTPLRQIGFFGPNFEGVFCLTGSETLTVWHHDSAQRICDFGSDIRTTLSQLSGQTIHYLVDCHWDSTHNRLYLLAGDHSGCGSVFLVEAGLLTHLYQLQKGHKGDIRSWCHIHSSNKFLTVGEDARICQWSPHATTATTAAAAAAAAARPQPSRKANPSGGPTRRTKRDKALSPY